MSDRNEFYKKLKDTLDDSSSFPSKYLFKFIVPNSKESVERIQAIFNYGGAVINTRSSKTGKFMSVSILIEMLSSEEIIEKYKIADQIEGIISL